MCVCGVVLDCLEARAVVHLKIAGTNYAPFVRFMKECEGWIAS